MKRALSCLLAAVLLLSLMAGCAREDDGDTHALADINVRKLAASMIASQHDTPDFYYVTDSDSVFSAYSILYLGEELAGKCEGGVICYPVGPYASEVAVFEFSSNADAKTAPEHMAAYIENRISAFYGYAPEEAELAGDGQIKIVGRFAALFILKDYESAADALEDAFGKDASELPELDNYAAPLGKLEEPDDDPDDEPGDEPGDEPDKDPDKGPDDEPDKDPSDIPVCGPVDDEDEYDHDLVLEALRTGAGLDSLSPKNLAIYSAVTDALSEVITPDMSDYEKELAVNDYLVFHAEYDPAEFDSGIIATPDPDNDNPYGLLINGLGICLGYTNTFQLFMDTLGIKCLTVHGFAHGWEEEHAWNLVELDGEWYAVDVTWNDPVFTGWTPTDSQRLYYARSYFNVTSDYLRQTEHFWNESVPEAEGTKYAYN